MKKTKNFLSQMLLILCVFNFTFKLYAQESKNQKESSLSDKIVSIYSEYVPDKNVGSSILVAKEGEIIYQNAFGLANVEFEVPMQNDIILGIGSITKQFTAISIIKLIEEGKISLDDKISKYIKCYPQGDKITIENLLRHTSGIISFEKLEKFRGKNGKFRDYTPNEVIEEIKKVPLEFEPGTQWSYSNSGYFMLGYIIEQVTQKTYQKILEENIFEPFGLKHTYYGSNTEIIKKKATGYKIENNTIIYADYISMSLAYSVGAIYSTTSDLYNFYVKLFNSEFIKPETLGMMCLPTILRTGEPCQYGLGFFIDEIQGAKAVGHTGGINGYSSSIQYIPNEKIVVCVLSNVEGTHSALLSRNIAATVLGKPFEKIKAINVEKAALEEYEGLYKNEKIVLEIDENEGKLFAKTAGNSFELIPYAIDSFHISGLDVSISFIRNKKLEIEKMVESKMDGTSKIILEKSPPIETKSAITAKPEILKLYEGDYQLNQETFITITTNSGKLFLQVTGQNQFKLIPENDVLFKVSGVDAAIEFKENLQQEIDKLVLFQYGKQIECKRVIKK